jgi:hypothetical protein
MPRIQMTPMVRIAMYALRVYLIFLLALILWRFVVILGGPKTTPPPATGPAASQPGHVPLSPR